MLRIETHAQFDFLSDAYCALFERSHASAFQHPVWLGAFYRHLTEPRGAGPVIVTIHDGDHLVGLLPLIRRRKFGFSMIESNNLGVSDYSAPVLDDRVRQDAGFAASAQDSIRKAIGRFDLLRIRPICPEHIADWQLLFGGTTVELDFSAHAVPLEPPMEDWRKANVERQLASQYLRKGRRWRKQHCVELKQLETPKDIETAIHKLADLRAGRFRDDPIQADFGCEFYASVAVEGYESGFTETWLMTSDDEPAAILFGLVHEGSFLYILIGADYETFGRHSPGFQIYDGIIEDWMGRGGTVFDFTIGDESFKAQFGAQAVPMSALLVPNSLAGHVLLRRLRMVDS